MKPSVLIVDDDRWTTRAVAATLSDDGGFDVLEPVHTGEDAVDAFAASRPDLVLMDVNMPPGMSGVDATAAIMNHDPQAHVVLLTTVAPGPGIARGLEAGAMAVLNKTAGESELVAVVRAASAGETPELLKGLATDIAISGDQLPEAPEAAPQLTERELELLTLLCEGHGYDEIAADLKLSMHTMKSHAQNLRLKLGAKNLAQLVIRALQFKFYSPE
ncbi:response regulator transcription factor [Brevibacterium spongiae]|uniref:Response regulator transcription factor n=1 Tax=Brevibacterium spongiae TaxID=2909672 RepID=A0ABY5SLZ5_9MICO|nr:response regulator transcription factor [Brevibacterium spongiae]UVI35543.1 response regulator transcription factor [Brevibacterium spongiae]